MINNHDEFQQALANKELKQAFLIAVSNSIEFKIKTAITSLDHRPAQIETKINLLGAYETNLDGEILAAQYQQTNWFHQQQVNSAYDIWQKNRETLVKILQILSGNEVDLTDLKVTDNRQSQQDSPELLAEAESNLDNYLDNFDFDLEPKAELAEQSLRETDMPEDTINQTDTSDHSSVEIFEEEIEEIEEQTEENWVDEIDPNITAEPMINSAESENLDFDQLEVEEIEENISEHEIADPEELIAEEVKIEAESGDWDLDWDGEVESDDEDTESMAEAVVESVTQESSPSLEVDDDWQEWLDEENVSNAQVK